MDLTIDTGVLTQQPLITMQMQHLMMVVVLQTAFGCLDSLAYNYNGLANTENGSCIYEVYGCIDESACNYDASVNTDRFSCTYLEVEYTINNNSCPNDEVGYIFVSPISGVAPYLYSWSNGGNNSFLMNFVFWRIYL